MNRHISITVLLFHITNIVGLNTVLNLDEINSVHYDIDIISNPVVKKNMFHEGEMMTVINKYGQEYVCSLPKIVPSDSDRKNDENILDQLVDISGLLKPMETAPCVIKTVDWWTYEFCYGSVIKQYHLEDNKASGPILILGKYESEYDWKNSTETKNRLQRFHSQFYVNGTKCDLTGEPRTTEVRFHCEDGVGDYIQRVDEPESCRYVVTLATTRVCHHPYLRLQAVRTPQAITCAPSLTEEQYHKYLIYQSKKAKEEETIKEKWLKQNADIMSEANNRQENRNILKPIVVNENDDDLKMNIKIFKLSPSPSKNTKNLQSEELKDVMEVDTEITLEENGAVHKEDSDDDVGELEIASNDLSDGSVHVETKNKGDTEDIHDELVQSLLSDEAKEILQLLKDGDESSVMDKLKSLDSLKSDDDDDEEDDDDDDDDDDLEEYASEQKLESSSQPSKSTSSDNYQKLQERLKLLGEMFIKPVRKGEYRKWSSDILKEINDIVENVDEEDINALEQEVKQLKKLLFKDGEDGDLSEEEEKVNKAFSSFMNAITKAGDTLTDAKKEMEVLEKYLSNQLKGVELSKLFDVDAEGKESSKELDKTETIKEESPTIEDEISQDTSSETSEKIEKYGSEPLHGLLNKGDEEETYKSKLEQTIKDKLQKMGLEKISKKFEVKILSPNSLDEENPDNPMLSQEETEAFQNMIVNLLSANAEELEEKENHRKLEKNYGFQWDEKMIEDEDE